MSVKYKMKDTQQFATRFQKAGPVIASLADIISKEGLILEDSDLENWVKTADKYIAALTGIKTAVALHIKEKCKVVEKKEDLTVDIEGDCPF